MSEALQLKDQIPDLKTVNRAIMPEEFSYYLGLPVHNVYNGARSGKYVKIPGLGKLVRFDPDYVRSLVFSSSNSSLTIRRKRRP